MQLLWKKIELTLVLAAAKGDGICCTHMSTKPGKTITYNPTLKHSTHTKPHSTHIRMKIPTTFHAYQTTFHTYLYVPQRTSDKPLSTVAWCSTLTPTCSGTRSTHPAPVVEWCPRLLPLEQRSCREVQEEIQQSYEVHPCLEPYEWRCVWERA